MRALRAPIGVAVLVAASSAFADDEVRYKGGPLPPNTHVEARREDQVVNDAVMSLAGFYIVSVWSAGIAQLACNGCTDHSYDLLYLPIAGPAIAAAMPAVQRLSPAWSVILVADSIGQAASGLVALVAYLLPSKRVIVKDASWRIVPSLGGVGITATF
ncbi:MAG TPA: hypothetical protein VGH87_26775 [Polyangiaceae bacterium]|jgi:hypothetical protein